MNVDATAEKRTFLSPLFTFLLPERRVDCILIWASLPVFLLLLNVGIGFLNPCLFTKYLPFLAVGAVTITFRFRALGLACSYSAIFFFLLIFYSDLSYVDRLWLMSLLFILALNIFILLLSMEETEECLTEMHSQTQEMKNLTHLREKEHQLAKTTSEEVEEELKAEIERLKQEAELRRIEKTQDLKRLEWVQSEIELLTSQKEEFVADSRKAREDALLQMQQLKKTEAALKKELITTQEAILSLQQLTAKTLREETVASQAIVASPGDQVEKPIFQDNVSNEVYSDLKKALAAAEGVSKQLREQFEEKSIILFQTRKELFQTQGKLIALEREVQSAKFDPNREESASLEKDVTQLTAEKEALEEEISHLEELISRILSQ